MAKKTKNKTKENDVSLLDVVGAEFTGLSVQSVKTGKMASIALQEIAWRPRAALFIAQKGIQVLEDIIMDDGEATKDRIKAIELLMAYTYGKPTQKVEHTGAGGGPIQTMVTRLADLEPEDLKAILEFKPQTEEVEYYPPSAPGATGYSEADIIDVEAAEVGGDGLE
jgi:hypothetical protein